MHTTYAKFRCLTAPGPSDLERTFHRLADALEGVDESGVLQVRLLDGEDRSTLALELQDGRCQIAKEPCADPRLELVIRVDVWLDITAGELSPIDAFLQGRLRLRGDAEFGKELLRFLSHGDGICDPCGGAS